MPDDFSGDGFPSDNTFNTMFGVVVVIVILIAIFVVISIVVNARRVAQSGRNPLTLQTDLELQLLNSQALAPAAAPVVTAPESIESRLAKLTDLHARKIITDDELATARAKVLAG